LVTRSKCTFWGWFTPTSANFGPTLNGSKISLRGLLSNVAGFIEIKDFGLGSFPVSPTLWFKVLLPLMIFQRNGVKLDKDLMFLVLAKSKKNCTFRFTLVNSKVWKKCMAVPKTCAKLVALCSIASDWDEMTKQLFPLEIGLSETTWMLEKYDDNPLFVNFKSCKISRILYKKESNQQLHYFLTYEIHLYWSENKMRTTARVNTCQLR